MLRKPLAAIIWCALCMGQMCGVSTPLPEPTVDLSAPIPEGLYTGTYDCTTTTTVHGPSGVLGSAVQNSSAPVSRQFGPDGTLLNAVGAPVQVGDYAVTNAGAATRTNVITSVAVGAGKFVVGFDSTIVDVPLGWSGVSTDTYILNSDGSLSYTVWSLVMTDTVAGYFDDMETTCSARLTR